MVESRMAGSPVLLSLCLALVPALGDAGESSSFRRGDSNADGELNLTDAVFTLDHLFRGGSVPSCLDAADSDDDGSLRLTDAVYSLIALFQGGVQPPEPGSGCGVDPTEDELDCRSFEPCGPAPAIREAWVARYEGPGRSGDAEPSGIVVDGEGNVYVTGLSHRDSATVKYAPDGTELWARRYNGPGEDLDRAQAIAVDGSNNILVTAASQGSGTQLDFATIKYRPDGTEEWIARYNGEANGDDWPHANAVDRAGNVYVAGSSWGGSTGHALLLKYSPDGTEQWARRYNTPGDGNGTWYALVLDALESVFVTGEGPTLKYSSQGDEIWDASFDALAGSIALDSGGVYVSGGGHEGPTVKYDLDGRELWRRRDVVYPRDVVTDSTGGVYVAGVFPVAVVKYDSEGRTQWIRTLSPTGNDPVLAVDTQGDLYVTARDPSGRGIYTTTKYGADGNEQWTMTYPGLGSVTAPAMAVDARGNVYVTGYSDKAYATIKYVQDGEGPP